MQHSPTTILVALMGFAFSVHAQNLEQPDKPAIIVSDTGLGHLGSLEWTALEGRIYFIQESQNLIDWTFAPTIELGYGLNIVWNFNSTSEKNFFRLRYTDQFAFDAMNEDFDGDSVTNMEELLQETNPFLAVDGDGNGLADDWESFYGLTSAVSDEEPDTLSNKIESLIGSNPNKAYTNSSQMDVYRPN